MIDELERVVLTTDIKEHHLQAGDIGTVVLVHGDGVGYDGVCAVVKSLMFARWARRREAE